MVIVTSCHISNRPKSQQRSDFIEDIEDLVKMSVLRRSGVKGKTEGVRIESSIQPFEYRISSMSGNSDTLDRGLGSCTPIVAIDP